MQQIKFVTNAREGKKRNRMFEMIHMIRWKLFDHKTPQCRSKTAEAPSITHDLKWLQGGTHSLKKRTQQKEQLFSAQLTESITSSWLLIGEACKTVKLPGDRPAASHRPEEPCLNYKLGPHLSVTQRNQCTVGCTGVTHMGYNIWKPKWKGQLSGFRQNRHFLLFAPWAGVRKTGRCQYALEVK